MCGSPYRTIGRAVTRVSLALMGKRRRRILWQSSVTVNVFVPNGVWCIPAHALSSVSPAPTSSGFRWCRR